MTTRPSKSSAIMAPSAVANATMAISPTTLSGKVVSGTGLRIPLLGAGSGGSEMAK